jgi:hypothetical protein
VFFKGKPHEKGQSAVEKQITTEVKMHDTLAGRLMDKYLGRDLWLAMRSVPLTGERPTAEQ